MANPAVFLDRDGTLVHPRHYPNRPEQLVLVPKIAAPLMSLQSRGFRLVVVTNQSGIARGLITTRQLDRMHAVLTMQLARQGANLSGIYSCPHHPEGTVPEYAVVCTCRKPRFGMLLQAARDLDIDLNRSWMIGDILDDVEAGNRAGCRSILVDLGTESNPAEPSRRPDHVARSTAHALQLVCNAERLGVCDDTHYIPDRWRDATSEASAPAFQRQFNTAAASVNHVEGHGHVHR